MSESHSTHDRSACAALHLSLITSPPPSLTRAGGALPIVYCACFMRAMSQDHYHTFFGTEVITIHAESLKRLTCRTTKLRDWETQMLPALPPLPNAACSLFCTGCWQMRGKSVVYQLHFTRLTQTYRSHSPWRL